MGEVVRSTRAIVCAIRAKLGEDVTIPFFTVYPESDEILASFTYNDVEYVVTTQHECIPEYEFNKVEFRSSSKPSEVGEVCIEDKTLSY